MDKIYTTFLQFALVTLALSDQVMLTIGACIAIGAVALILSKRLHRG